ncbi:SLATT domain-containing protein [Bacillus cereus]|nr:SLATT domain-containing protein [Bacillus cereus]
MTFLLGFKGAFNSNIISNIALGLSASITIINGMDAFYNHRGLWEKDVRTLSSLKELKLDIDYYIAGEIEDDLSLKVINEFRERLQRILSDDIKTWSDTRTEIKVEESNN